MSAVIDKPSLRREIGRMIVAKSAKQYEAIYGKPAILKAKEAE